MTKTMPETMLDPSLPSCPYKGLQPYTEEDRAYFFGRERDREIIISNLYAAPLTILYGASGVGKSSVLLAGVVPELKEFPRVAVVVFRDWQGPEFRSALAQAVLAELARSLGKEPDVDPHLQFDEFLAQCMRLLRGQLFFILDQFEEYFLYQSASQSEGSFDADLARAVNRQEIRVNFLFSMREDGLSRLGHRFQGRIPNVLGNLLRLDHLDRQAAADAIRLPLAEYNRRLTPGQMPVSIEDGLVEILLEEVEVKTGNVALDRERQGKAPFQTDDPPAKLKIETPFLQMVLTRLWNEEMSSGSRRLQLGTLTRLGGTENIARTHLDEEMKHLKETERAVAAQLFHFLVTPDGKKIAQDPGALAAWADVPEAQARDVLTRLSADMRILRCVSAAGQAARYEIFHDTLAPAILEWRARYVLAQKQAEAERQRVEAERQLTRERQRVLLLRLGVIGLLILFVMGVVVIWAFQQRREALRQGLESQARELAAIAISQLRFDPERSLLLARKAVDISPIEQAQPALRQVLLESRVRAELRGHTDAVYSAAFSPDGKLVVTASSDRTARVWDTATKREVAVLQELRGQDAQSGHDAEVNSAAFSPDGKLLVTASKDNTARLWMVNTWRLSVAPLRHKDEVRSAVFSSDGRLMVTASGSTAQVWETATDHPLTKISVPSGYVYSAAFSRDGKLVVTAGTDRKACVWDAGTGRKMICMNGHTDYVSDARFSADGKLVITASYDGTARLWEAESGRQTAELRGHTGHINSATFNPDSRFILTASDDGTARLWETDSGNSIAVLRGHADKVNSAAFSPDGQLIVTASSDKTVRLWGTSTLLSETKLCGHPDYVKWAAFSPDGRLVVTASVDKTARIWEASTGRQLTVLNGHRDWVNSAVFSPDGKLVVTASDDSTAMLWETDTGRQVGKLPHKDFVKSAVFSPDGKLVMTASGTSAQTWAVSTGLPVGEPLNHPSSVFGVAFSPNGKLVVTACLDKTARLWRTDIWQQISQLKGHTDAIESAAFSPDGRLIVTASRDRTARVWEVSTGQNLAELLGHTEIVSHAAFSPSGELIVTASADRTSQLWEVNTRQGLIVLRGQQRGVNSADFSPDGKSIVTAGQDKTAQIYRCEECAPLAGLRRLADQRITLTADEQERFLRQIRNQ